MMHFTSFGSRRSSQPVHGAADFLRRHDKMASLLPAVARMAALQRDCAAILPDMFQACSVLQAGPEQLVLAVPNAALAAKLKQKLPKLRESLLQRGWQIQAIRLKVQLGQHIARLQPEKPLKTIPQQAVSALAALGESLEDEPRNGALKAAIARLVQRQRDSSPG